MKNHGKISIKKQITAAILFITIILITLLIAANIYSIDVYNRKLAESNARTMSYCVSQIENSLKAVDNSLGFLVAGNSDFIRLSGGTTPLQAHLSSLSIYSQLKTIMPSYPSIGGFFIYSVPSDIERDMFSADFTYEEKLAIQEFVRENVKNDSITNNMKWKWAKIDGEMYLFRFFGGRGTYLVAMAPVNKLISISDWNMDKETVPILSTEENVPLTNIEFIEQNKINLDGDYSKYFISGEKLQYMVVGEKIENTDCNLTFLISGAGYFDSLDRVQILLLFLSILAAAAAPLLLFWLSRLILVPLAQMQTTMERIQQGDLTAQAPEDLKIQEFCEVSQTFNGMMTQIKDLRIEAYENEIETEKAKLRYLQLQIRPHFFLNCLKSVYAFAEHRQYDNLQKMILAFSKHIRYIFQDNMEFVPLGRELEHIRNYIEIQCISAVHPPQLVFDINEELYELPIPPLSIQTFVENSIKHGTSPDKSLIINIKASVIHSEGDNYADIIVEDSGDGFTDDVLIEINNTDNKIYAHHHVGLNNIKHRLRLIYGDGVVLAFFNSDIGSVSEVILPLKQKDKSEKG